MRWWQIARTAVIGWLLALGLWIGLASPDFLVMVAVLVAGTTVLAVALSQRAPWWRGRTGAEMSAEQIAAFTRRDSRIIVVVIVVVIVVAFVRGILGP